MSGADLYLYSTEPIGQMYPVSSLLCLSEDGGRVLRRNVVHSRIINLKFEVRDNA